MERTAVALLQDLIKQIDDPTLRQRIMTEVGKLTKQKKFGLVFEEHLPECTPLYDVGIKIDSNVALKSGQVSDIYIVRSINEDKAVCEHKSDHTVAEFALDELVAIAEFGEPIYPYLKPIDTVCNAPDSDLWHTLIEADNYHALQLLEYLYAGKVDCIYIDPPYNTGARDWKYNNDYVDGNDSYRHSKWLSFMEKRLKLAKKLLSSDGVMVIAIDDYEAARLIQLTEEIFSQYEVELVVVNHHPQGGAADNISRTHEYALFVVPRGAKVVKGNRIEGIEERWSLTRGGTDVRNLRIGRPNSFYAIYVDKDTRIVKGVGPRLDVNTPYNKDEAPEGCIAFYPIGKDGKERVWRYGRESMIQHIETGDIICTEKMTLNVVKRREVKYAPVFSVWTNGRYNAGTFGTNMLLDIFSGEQRFSYPKSLYTVYDCIKFSIRSKRNALIVDFFSGSGTTLHAVNLLNAEDGGKRRCIMVTNNEVSEAEVKKLAKQGYKPGDEEWEKLGIARYVTWPRTKCSIQGIDVNGEPLSGEYFTSMIKSVEYPRTIKQIVLNGNILTTAARKSIVALLGRENLPQSLVKADSHYIISEKHATSIIFDIEYIDDYMDELNENNHVTDVYVVTDNNAAFNKLKEEITDVLGPVQKIENVTLPMADGFKANVSYFKLGFLDKAAVRIGRQFREMLPTLWMKAGCYGPCPELAEQKIPDFMVLPENRMAILNDSSCYMQFADEVQKAPEIETVYLVTDSDADYRSMAKELKIKQTYQLYRDYLDNFRINSRR